jgi:FtsZ-binding cell division protein ZapB
MARGWNSKAVEEQMDITESKEKESDLPQISPEQQQRIRERESLELSRSRVQQELAAATHPNYRSSLQAALGYLEEKIAGFE